MRVGRVGMSVTSGSLFVLMPPIHAMENFVLLCLYWCVVSLRESSDVWCIVFCFFISFNSSDTWSTSVSVFCVQFCHITPSALTPFPYLTLPCTTSYWEHPASACFCKYIVSRALKWRAGQEMFCRFFFLNVLILFLKILFWKISQILWFIFW